MQQQKILFWRKSKIFWSLALSLWILYERHTSWDFKRFISWVFILEWSPSSAAPWLSIQHHSMADRAGGCPWEFWGLWVIQCAAPAQPCCNALSGQSWRWQQEFGLVSLPVLCIFGKHSAGLLQMGLWYGFNDIVPGVAAEKDTFSPCV